MIVQVAAQNLNQLGGNTATNMGNTMTNAGNLAGQYQQQGIINMSNQLMSGIGTYQNYLQQQQLMNMMRGNEEYVSPSYINQISPDSYVTPYQTITPSYQATDYPAGVSGYY